MTNFSKFDVVVVKFPFASSLKYKARPAVIVSNENFNDNTRGTLVILAISSQVNNKLSIEENIVLWEDAGLLKPSILKSALITIEKTSILSPLGSLQSADRIRLTNLLKEMCL